MQGLELLSMWHVMSSKSRPDASKIRRQEMGAGQKRAGCGLCVTYPRKVKYTSHLTISSLSAHPLRPNYRFYKHCTTSLQSRRLNFIFEEK